MEALLGSNATGGERHRGGDKNREDTETGEASEGCATSALDERFAVEECRGCGVSRQNGCVKG